jgi:hypothetical protein
VAIQVSDSYVVAAKVFDVHGEKIADQLAIKWVHDMTANLTSDGLVK